MTPYRSNFSVLDSQFVFTFGGLLKVQRSAFRFGTNG
jgi:hypothetical protein